MTPQQRVRISLSGSALILAGFLLTWYSVTFSPPGGTIVVHQFRLNAFTERFNGISEGHTDLGAALRLTSIVLIVLSLLELASLYPPVQRQVKRLVKANLPAQIAGPALHYAKAAALVVQALAIIAFIVLFVAFSKIGDPQILASRLGGDTNAVAASHYLSVHFGIGIWLLLIGILVSATILARQIGIFLIVFISGTVVLAIVHPASLSWFFHHVTDVTSHIEGGD